MPGPLSGFAETFAQYAMELAPGGGSDAPEPDPGAQAGIFVTDGTLTITLDGSPRILNPGGYAYIPPRRAWTIRNTGTGTARFMWVRKRWQPAAGLTPARPDHHHR